MGKSTSLSALLGLAVIAVLAASGGGVAATDARGPGGARLQSFGSCGALLDYAKQHTLSLVGAWGYGNGPMIATAPARAIGEGAPARAGGDAAGSDYSGTNVQEEGVDEPDLVKSNGAMLFVVRSDRLFALDVRVGRPRLVGSLQLPSGGSNELLLHGDRLLVLANGGPVAYGARNGIAASMIAPYPAKSTLLEVNVGDPSAMRIVRSLTLDAQYLSARLVGDVARIVTVSGMQPALPFVRPADGTADAQAASLARNRNVVRESRIGSWLPTYQVHGRRGQVLSRHRLVPCRNVRRPASYSGLGLLTVLTVDLSKGLAPIDSDSVVADGRTVYASQDSLYVATQRSVPQPAAGAAATEPPRTTTAIHRFDISSPTATTYQGSGTVDGYLLGQWSLSEYKGVLRVASTEEPPWWNAGVQGQSESYVTTLAERDGGLARLGRVGGLGKGERVYAVRFMGDTGYVVTFRQVDPLYTLDLATPSRPAVLGELKITGYSAYLHPLGDDLLLGIGQDATDEGRLLGTQLSLFDVSDLRRPVRLGKAALGSGWSEAESDHHAFLWWAPSRLAVLPVQAWEGTPFAGAVGFRVTRAGIAEVGRVTHTGETMPAGDARVGGAPIRRSLVVRDTLYTVSDSGVKAVSLSSFADRGFVALPS